MKTGSQLVFIISQPRSGSTLTQKLISNNNEVNTVSEPWILLPYLTVFRPDIISATYHSDVARKGIQDYLQKLNLEKSYKENLRSFLLTLYPISEDKKYFIDKTPRYYEILDELMEIFPDAKYLILKRSPFASLYSMLQTWSGFKTDIKSLSTFYRDFLIAPNKINLFTKRISSSSNVFEIKYEDIVLNPEKNVKAIYEWLQIPYTNAVLEIGNNEKVKGIYGDDVYKRKTMSNIVSDKNADWEDKIKENKNTFQFFNDYSKYLGKEFLNEYGYSEMNEKISRSLKFGKTDFEKLLEFVESEKLKYV